MEWKSESASKIDRFFTSNLSQLNLLRYFVAEVCQQVPGDKETFTEILQLALNEIFCNISSHAYNNKKDQPILIRVKYQQEGIEFEVLDQGEPFDLYALPIPNFSGKTEGGFGLYIVRKTVDRLEYIPKNGQGTWNHMIIYKQFVR